MTAAVAESSSRKQGFHFLFPSFKILWIGGIEGVQKGVEGKLLLSAFGFYVNDF